VERLDVIEQILTCTNCELAAQCSSPVPLRGNPARIAIIGEAPGETEDRHNKPFIGPAGRLLARLLAAAGITESMGIANTVSCFPHATPTRDHIVACEHNKWTQVDFLDPTWILLLGGVALSGMRRELLISKARARPFLTRDRICFATYHPAAALRNGTYETTLAEDLVRFKQLVDAGADRWTDFIPDTCAGCGVEPIWHEDSGLGWCALHLPSSQQAAYNANQDRIAADLSAARHRAQTRRDTAIAAVEANADDDWLADAYDELVVFLQRHPQFFVDDWWAETKLAEPRESRALGPVVMKAARAGLMVKSGTFRKSIRSNMTEKPVWQSCIYRSGH
jgi:uracil-DNA glycosylase family 4